MGFRWRTAARLRSSSDGNSLFRAAADLPQIASYFGLTYKPENGLITHSLSTAVIGPDGKIVSWYHGSEWQVSELVKDAEGALRGQG